MKQIIRNAPKRWKFFSNKAENEAKRRLQARKNSSKPYGSEEL
ncbi:hypothetical protein [uncultured Oscillibacter sp.]|nr:hypothetical protein [uncultured Oscillibacter sp.]